MEKLSGFMIMPFLSKKEQTELTQKGHDGSSELVKKKKLCEEFYESIIQRSCTESNIEITRADKIFKTQEVISKIIHGIETSDIVIVDLTMFRPNVLYELGIAHHIDPNRTLLITQEDFKDIPFDLKGIAHMQYDSTNVTYVDEIKERLKGLADYHYEKEICIGISPYPELMILEKKLKDKNIPIAIRYIPWDETFSHFQSGENIDFVFANWELCQKQNSRHTDFIYRGDLIKYNSFYLISNNNDIKSFDELEDEFPDSKERIIKTFEQFNDKDRNTVIFASEKTDHKENFLKFNSIFGKNLLDKYELHTKGSPKEILTDFISSKNGDLFIGGIPERINLLKNKNYKLIIDCNNVKHSKDFENIIDSLQQRNGIVYPREQEKGIDKLEEIIRILYENWKEAYSDIIYLQKTGDLKTLASYLAPYNNSPYVKTFDAEDDIELKVNSSDFVKNYIKSNLIIVE